MTCGRSRLRGDRPSAAQRRGRRHHAEVVDVPIRSGADRKKWSSRVLTTAPMLLGRVARGLSWSCQTWAAPGTTGRSARSRRSCPVRRGTRWRRRGGGGANGDGAGPGRIRSAPGDRQHRSPVAPKPRPRPHRQDKHWATTEGSERKFRPPLSHKPASCGLHGQRSPTLWNNHSAH